jgi:hypothetical protein
MSYPQYCRPIFHIQAVSQDDIGWPLPYPSCILFMSRYCTCACTGHVHVYCPSGILTVDCCREGRTHRVPAMFEPENLLAILGPEKYEYVLDR